MSQKRVSRCDPKPQYWNKAVVILALLLAAGYVAIGQQPATQPARESAAQDEAQHTAPSAANPANQADTPATAAAGVKAYIDPATGRLRPAEQEEMRAAPQLASPAVRSATPAPRTFRHPSGATGAMLGPEQMVFSVATIGDDGTIQYECVQGEAAAEQKVKAPRQGGLDVQ